MTQTTFAFTFLLGSLFGAFLMLLAVARAMNLIALQKQAREFWFKHWLQTNSKMVEAQTKLKDAQAKLSKGGLTAAENHRQRVRETTAALRAEIEQSRQPELKVAA